MAESRRTRRRSPPADASRRFGDAGATHAALLRGECALRPRAGPGPRRRGRRPPGAAARALARRGGAARLARGGPAAPRGDPRGRLGLARQARVCHRQQLRRRRPLRAAADGRRLRSPPGGPHRPARSACAPSLAGGRTSRSSPTPASPRTSACCSPPAPSAAGLARGGARLLVRLPEPVRRRAASMRSRYSTQASRRPTGRGQFGRHRPRRRGGLRGPLAGARRLDPRGPEPLQRNAPLHLKPGRRLGLRPLPGAVSPRRRAGAGCGSRATEPAPSTPAASRSPPRAGPSPGSPLVGWKGSLGHTLGSCGLVELAIAIESVRAGRTPGTIGGTGPTMGASVATREL